MHRIVGNAVEVSRRADIDAVLPELARHFHAAGDIDRAIDYATRAGQRADALLAFEDAVQFFQAALDAMEQRPEPDDAGALPVAAPAGRGAAQSRTTIRAHWRRCAMPPNSRPRCGEPELCARAALAYEQVAWRDAQPADPPPRQLLERALRQLPEAHAAIRTQVAGALARALVHSGAAAEAKVQGERAIAMARQLGDPGVLATCLYYLLDVRRRPRQRGIASATRPRRSPPPIQVGNVEMVHIAHAWRLISFMERGDIGLAEAELDDPDPPRSASPAADLRNCHAVLSHHAGTDAR